MSSTRTPPPDWRRRGGSAAPAGRRCCWSAAMAEPDDLLDPGPANAAGAAHGQLASRMVDGGLALSCHKLVEDGARTLMLLAPGFFRLDVRPVEDTLQVM